MTETSSARHGAAQVSEWSSSSARRQWPWRKKTQLVAAAAARAGPFEEIPRKSACAVRTLKHQWMRRSGACRRPWAWKGFQRFETPREIAVLLE